jgi:hypothetical protein
LPAQDADSLRFLSALRMNATFPYITPNVSLPSTPAMEIMDAGLSDNFGVSDAVRFLYVFRQWIGENTSGVILLSIRDTPRSTSSRRTPTCRCGTRYPRRWAASTATGATCRTSERQQRAVRRPLAAGAAAPGRPHLRRRRPRARRRHHGAGPQRPQGPAGSLSWRLTEREKAGIRQAIHNDPNQATIRQLQAWLEGDPAKPEIRLTQKQALR